MMMVTSRLTMKPKVASSLYKDVRHATSKAPPEDFDVRLLFLERTDMATFLLKDFAEARGLVFVGSATSQTTGACFHLGSHLKLRKTSAKS